MHSPLFPPHLAFLYFTLQLLRVQNIFSHAIAICYKQAVYQDRILINNMSDDGIYGIKVVEEMKPFVGEPQNKTRHLWFNNNEFSPPGLDARFCQSTFRYSQ